MAIRRFPRGTRSTGEFKVKKPGPRPEYPQRYGAVVVLLGPVKSKAPKRVTA